jgi:hypothetical protein
VSTIKQFNQRVCARLDELDCPMDEVDCPKRVYVCDWTKLIVHWTNLIVHDCNEIRLNSGLKFRIEDTSHTPLCKPPFYYLYF